MSPKGLRDFGGVLLGSGEVRGGPWRGLGVPGRFRRCPGGAFEKRHFLFCWKGMCHRSNQILMFSILGGFMKRSVVIVLCYFVIVFRSLFFAKQ